MSDLTGEDAFDRVLESALESRNDARKAQEAFQLADTDARRLARENDTLKDELRRKEAELRQATEERELKLYELWEAAEGVRNLAQSLSGDHTKVSRLKKALEAARDYCNQPPF